MALTTIEYGSLASSEVMNNNFEYLDNKITEISDTLISNTASIYSNIASINSSISSLRESLSENISNLQNSLETMFSENGLYISTYKDGTSWYREYFSDSSKTQRVWLEQGFITPSVSWTANLIKTYNLVKEFSSTDFTVIALPTITVRANNVSGLIAIPSVTTSTIDISTGNANTFGVRVYACGI